MFSSSNNNQCCISKPTMTDRRLLRCMTRIVCADTPDSADKPRDFHVLESQEQKLDPRVYGIAQTKQLIRRECSEFSLEIEGLLS